jgi:hypothetical protein
MPGPGFKPATWSGSGSCRSTYQCWLRCVCPSRFTLIILLAGVFLLALVTFSIVSVILNIYNKLVQR